MATTDDVPSGLTPFDDVIRDDRDQDSEAIPFDYGVADDERAQLPPLPEQERSDIPWADIRRAIETVGLGVKTTSDVYRVVQVAITGKDPFAGIDIKIPTGQPSQEDKDLARIRALAESK